MLHSRRNHSQYLSKPCEFSRHHSHLLSGITSANSDLDKKSKPWKKLIEYKGNSNGLNKHRHPLTFKHDGKNYKKVMREKTLSFSLHRTLRRFCLAHGKYSKMYVFLRHQNRSILSPSSMFLINKDTLKVEVFLVKQIVIE